MQEPPHILVVEDNEHVTSALRILLESASWRVSVAGSIIDALSVAQADPPSVVLLDLTLPDGDGLRLVEPLRDLGARRIVVLTGHDDIDTKKRCFDAGCFDLLVKPVAARDLVEKSRAWIAELE
jgi:DNA-binding response OmpR family regulator